MVIDRKDFEGKLFRVEELAEKSGYHIDSLRRLIRQGKIRAARPPHSRSYIVTGEAFLAWLMGDASQEGKANE